MRYDPEIRRRRTFAIISHPDAGKTTLTEKFLLFGGAIQTAGAVKSNKIKKHATSDFMEIERQRGISVATSVMSFEYKGMLVNLLDNAFQHGGPEARVRVAAVHPAGFAVMDDGQGISASNQAKVFDRFFTTDRARGTGLGLALARAIIERHGGQLTLQSKPGETIFRVTLPSAEPALPVG
jgi:peptide subunit release factor RF-3